MPLAYHFPMDFAAEKRLPPLAQLASRRIFVAMPAADFDQQRPIGQLEIGVEMFQRIAWKQKLPAFVEEIA